MRVHLKHERKLGVRTQTIAGRKAQARMTKKWRKKKRNQDRATASCINEVEKL
jgi:hypothetical protein